jgi:hypothetical protein
VGGGRGGRERLLGAADGGDVVALAVRVSRSAVARDAVNCLAPRGAERHVIGRRRWRGAGTGAQRLARAPAARALDAACGAPRGAGPQGRAVWQGAPCRPRPVPRRRGAGGRACFDRGQSDALRRRGAEGRWAPRWWARSG